MKLASLVQLPLQESLKTTQGNYMKAIVISALLFFSLRAMSAEVAENKKSPCPLTEQRSRKVEPKFAVSESAKDVKDVASKAIKK